MTGNAFEARERSRVTELMGFGQMSMTSERDGSVHVIALSGELDLAAADRVEQELRRVEATDAGSIVVDLSGLTFMDSTGARLLWQADARSRADANRLRLRRGPRAVQRVFEISGIADMLPFAD
jgi:anti-sigma B factor antagonist